MNTRIKELIKQATVLTDDPNERVQRLQLNPALLVELVVKECASLVVDDDNAYDVLKQFGVEE